MGAVSLTCSATMLQRPSQFQTTVERLSTKANGSSLQSMTSSTLEPNVNPHLELI